MENKKDELDLQEFYDRLNSDDPNDKLVIEKLKQSKREMSSDVYNMLKESVLVTYKAIKEANRKDIPQEESKTFKETILNSTKGLLTELKDEIEKFKNETGNKK